MILAIRVVRFSSLRCFYDCDIPHILTRHEQGAIHAAEGYARVTGKPGVVVVTSGPGATNVLTGIADAMSDSIPLVIFTGQVHTPGIGKDAFQEADMIGLTIPITKYNYQVRDVRDLPKLSMKLFILQALVVKVLLSWIFQKTWGLSKQSLYDQIRLICRVINRLIHRTHFNWKTNAISFCRKQATNTCRSWRQSCESYS